MEKLMAIAPNGGIAVSNLGNNGTTEAVGHALAVEGRAYDPFGNVWHWTGRQPYEPALARANTLLQEQDPQWTASDPDTVAAATGAARRITLPEDEAATIAERIAAMDDDPYLMAVAAARVMLRNMTNGATVATFPDGSQAYVDSQARTVQPASSG